MKKEKVYVENWMNSQTEENKQSNKKSTIKSFILGLGGLVLGVGAACLLTIPMDSMLWMFTLASTGSLLAVGTTYTSKFIRHCIDYICSYNIAIGKKPKEKKQKENNKEKKVERVFDRQTSNEYKRRIAQSMIPNIINNDEDIDEQTYEYDSSRIIES